jgi:hypothetical protein
MSLRSLFNSRFSAGCSDNLWPPTATHHFLQTWRHCKFTLLRLLMSYQGVDICASQPNAITGDPLHTANEVTLCI